MKITENELIVHLDIDGTIILWSEPLIPGDNKIEMQYAGRSMYFTPHKPNIDLIKQYKARGFYIMAQSANGYRWVVQVIKMLGLEDYVDEAKTKPLKVVDDLPTSSLTNSLVCLPSNFYDNTAVS